MTTKHTPGPWVVGPVDDTVVTHLGADGVRYKVAAIDGDYNQPETWPVMEANARLIAASPDLLEALKAIVSRIDIDCCDQDCVDCKPYRAARAAIAKADGSALSPSPKKEG